MNTETLQIVIIASLSISTILITIIAIQTILLLKDFRKIVSRADYISNGLVTLTKTIEKSLEDMKGISEMALFVGNLFNKVVRSKKQHD